MEQCLSLMYQRDFSTTDNNATGTGHDFELITTKRIIAIDKGRVQLPGVRLRQQRKGAGGKREEMMLHLIGADICCCSQCSERMLVYVRLMPRRQHISIPANGVLHNVCKV
jgi:hypothetical protein